MANQSIYQAFERMWQHIIAIVDDKADKNDLSVYETKEDSQIKYNEITEAKADWNQNDENAIDYVKNRTHWIDANTEELLAERAITGEYNTIDEMTGIEYRDKNKLIITFDGVKYECLQFAAVDGTLAWGDSRLYNEDESNPVDVPFLIIGYNDMDFTNFGSEISKWDITIKSDIAEADHTIKIESESGEIVYHLDEKFIPDTIARADHMHHYDELMCKPVELIDVKYLYNDYVTTNDRSALEFTLSEALVEGKKYIMMVYDINGTNIGKLKFTGNNSSGIHMTHDDNDIVFDIEYYKDDRIIVITFNTRIDLNLKNCTLLLKFYEADSYKVKQLDEEFIPDTIARVSDLENIDVVTSWNDLTDKPFYKQDNRKYLDIEWDGDINNCISCEKIEIPEANSGFYFCKVSEDIDAVDFNNLANYTLFRQETLENGEYYVREYNLSDISSIQGNILLDNDTRIFVVKDETYVVSGFGVTLTKGIYFVKLITGKELKLTLRLVSTEPISGEIEIKKIDPEFLPDNLAGIPTDEETLAMLAECGIIDPAVNG